VPFVCYKMLLKVERVGEYTVLLYAIRKRFAAQECFRLKQANSLARSWKFLMPIHLTFETTLQGACEFSRCRILHIFCPFGFFLPHLPLLDRGRLCTESAKGGGIMCVLPQPLDPTVTTKIPRIYKFYSSYSSLKVKFASSYDPQRKKQNEVFRV